LRPQDRLPHLQHLAEIRQRIDEFLTRVTLKDILEDSGGKMSQGIKQDRTSLSEHRDRRAGCGLLEALSMALRNARSVNGFLRKMSVGRTPTRLTE